jgi:hypothetical protein
LIAAGPSPADLPLDSEEARAWPARASTVSKPVFAAAIFLHRCWEPAGMNRIMEGEKRNLTGKAELDGRNPMSKPAEDFEEFARDCVRLAEQADTPALREKLLGLAREWMQAVMDVEDAEARTGK